MAKYRVQGPDGKVHVFEGPEGASPSDVESFAAQTFSGKQAPSAPTETTLAQDVVQQGKNAVGGLIRGAGSIGATFARPFESSQENEDRRNRIDTNMADLVGADPNSLLYKGSKIGGEIAGTAGAGGLVGNALSRLVQSRRVASMFPELADKINPLIQSIGSSGMTTGASVAPGAVNALQNLAVRGAGGLFAGGTQAAIVDPKDAVMGAAVGGALPVLAGAVGAGAKLAGAAMRGNPVSSSVQNLADRAKQLGIDIPADRLVDSKPMNAVASALNYIPMSGRAATEEKMVKQLDTALSRTFGQDSPNVTQALRTAGADLGGKFDTVLQANTLKITPTFKQALADAENQATNELGAEGASIIHKQIASILTKGVGGEIDGQAAYNIKKTLDRIGQRNTPEAFYARDLKKSLMNALNDSLGPQEAEAFKTLRQQYGNMLSLENLAQNGAEGGISVARLANMKNIGNPDMQELADIAAQFVKTREGQHGSMQRGAAALGIGGTVGLPGLAASMAAGRATNMVLNSNMAKKLVTGQPVIGNALERVAPITYKSAPVLSGQ